VAPAARLCPGRPARAWTERPGRPLGVAGGAGVPMSRAVAGLERVLLLNLIIVINKQKIYFLLGGWLVCEACFRYLLL